MRMHSSQYTRASPNDVKPQRIIFITSARFFRKEKKPIWQFSHWLCALALVAVWCVCAQSENSNMVKSMFASIIINYAPYNMILYVQATDWCSPCAKSLMWRNSCVSYVFFVGIIALFQIVFFLFLFVRYRHTDTHIVHLRTVSLYRSVTVAILKSTNMQWYSLKPGNEQSAFDDIRGDRWENKRKRQTWTESPSCLPVCVCVSSATKITPESGYMTC